MLKKIFLITCLVAAVLTTVCGCIAVRPLEESQTPMDTEATASSEEATQTPGTPSPKPSETPEATPQPQISPAPGETVQDLKQQYKAVELVIGEPFFVDLDNDGETGSITVYHIEEGFGLVKLLVDDGGTIMYYEIGGGYPGSVYYYENSGGTGILLSRDAMSDDYWFSVYRFDGTYPAETDGVSGLVEKIEGDQLEVFGYMYTLGTWEARRSYTLTDDFMLEPNGLWQITRHDYTLVTSKELPVRLLTDGVYVDGVLSPGTELWPTATDEKSVVLFETSDGRQGKLDITRESWMVMIDGIQDTEWFVDVPYCG